MVVVMVEVLVGDHMQAKELVLMVT